MKRAVILLLAPAIAAAAAPAAAEQAGLRPASEFAAIADEDERARSLMTEAGKVLTHPRCVNCHPAGDAPLQGEDGRMHEPPAVRGRGGLGAIGMECRACHQRANFDPGRVPGAPQWHLAPRKMGWEGLSVGAICEQLKDPERNGGRTLDEIVEHMAEDALVGWGWEPGADREPAPGSQALFGELIEAWADAGAACPD